MNKNPHQARQARKAKRHAGTVDQLRGKLWRALERCEEMIESEEPLIALKAIHALSQAAGPYLKAIEIGELEARIAALEAQA